MNRVIANKPEEEIATMTETFWQDKRVIVTGGAGFLGSFVTAKLKARGAADIFIPRKKDYDLTQREAIENLYSDALKNIDPKNVVVIHLAANVGGIGANREHPAEFFYDNMIMGVELMHHAYKRGVGKFVATGTVCALTPARRAAPAPGAAAGTMTWPAPLPAPAAASSSLPRPPVQRGCRAAGHRPCAAAAIPTGGCAGCRGGGRRRAPAVPAAW